MTATIAVVAPGAMGSAIGRRLADHGARVLTGLDGRSAVSCQWAQAAGMIAAGFEEMAEADLVLSIVPPSEAVAVARLFAPAIGAGRRKPAFVDCNAINPATMTSVAEALRGSGCPVVDGCIIGAPPKSGEAGPAFYVSGDPGGTTLILHALGLDLHLMDAPLGAASALKMSYAGITKGLTALGTAMLLGAARAGSAEALRTELARSQPQLLARLKTAVPDMLPKAYRWVAEMREIAGFLGEDDPASLMFEGAARLYDLLAEDQAGERRPLSRLLRGVSVPAQE